MTDGKEGRAMGELSAKLSALFLVLLLGMLCQKRLRLPERFWQSAVSPCPP